MSLDIEGNLVIIGCVVPATNKKCPIPDPTYCRTGGCGRPPILENRMSFLLHQVVMRKIFFLKRESSFRHVEFVRFPPTCKDITLPLRPSNMFQMHFVHVNRS